ncbi:hypothetical protein J7U46_04030 [Pelomonas sp. V22]|uniref:DUF6622 family protein n=1 Tax=Pelomonas sp. V22 TaxID=2822139 RepID=UPI0024A7D746|nr:DUF6622 family protein [Pelomonas sp. V22]MDI4632207.1 hypothetical protein [Pelomonas sp. V22]
MQTLTMILANVPVWVWALLAFIIAMGLRLSREQRMSRSRLLLVPAIWLAYGAWGVEATFGLNAAPLLAWAAGLAVSVKLVRSSGWASLVRKEAGLYVVPGSWIPMGLMLTIFCAKFALGMGLAMNPALAHQTGVALGFSALFGLLSGAFLGRSLNILSAGRHATSPAFA